MSTRGNRTGKEGNVCKLVCLQAQFLTPPELSHTGTSGKDFVRMVLHAFNDTGNLLMLKLLYCLFAARSVFQGRQRKRFPPRRLQIQDSNNRPAQDKHEPDYARPQAVKSQMYKTTRRFVVPAAHQPPLPFTSAERGVNRYFIAACWYRCFACTQSYSQSSAEWKNKNSRPAQLSTETSTWHMHFGRVGTLERTAL